MVVAGCVGGIWLWLCSLWVNGWCGGFTLLWGVGLVGGCVLVQVVGW